MIINLVNSSKIDISITISNQADSFQDYRLSPDEEKQLIIDSNQINLNISHCYSTKVKMVTKIVADLRLTITDSTETEKRINIFQSEKFTEKGIFILDFLRVETDADSVWEEYYIRDKENVRNEVTNYISKEKKKNKRFDRIWPIILMMGGSTFVLRQLTSGLLFVILLIVDYILIFLLNKLVDKVFKIDKGITEQQKEKIDAFDKLCNDSYLFEFINEKRTD